MKTLLAWFDEKHEAAGLLMILVTVIAALYRYVDGYTFAALLLVGCILFVGVGYFRGMKISRQGVEFDDGDKEG